MDLRSGLPYHLILNGLPHVYPTLRSDTLADVVVVGGGITGALCAHAFVKAGLSVVVLEGRSVGTASTSASTALLQYEIDTPLHRLREQVGRERADRSYLLCAQAVTELLQIAHEVGVHGVTRKSLQYASRPRDVDGMLQELEARHSIGLNVEWLDARTLKERYGFRKAGAPYSTCAAEVDPYLLTHALFQEVVARGGRVYDRTPMEKHQRERDGTYVLRTKGGHRVTARHVVMATGYAGEGALHKAVMDLDSTMLW
jgi:glycine/D-amino acid oxidase-like deaminating enzyme